MHVFSAAKMLGICLVLLCTPALAAKEAERPDAASVSKLRQLLSQPEDSIDLAQAKVAIDRMVDSSVDELGTLRELDRWAAKVRARFPPDASNKQKVDLMISTLYQAGPWNDNRPFAYDFTDPFGNDLHNALLSTYLERRQGQCTVMPIAIVLLGQKLGLPMTLTTAPFHLIAKYGDEELGAWTNLDATSGLFHPDSGYEQALNISPAAIQNEIFLRPYTRRESVAVFATAVLIPYYLQENDPYLAIQIIDLILDANPKDVFAMMLKSNAYIMLVDQRFRSKYPLAEQIPAAEQPEFLAHNRNISQWRLKAEALGWQEWTQADWDKYLEHFEQQKLNKLRRSK